MIFILVVAYLVFRKRRSRLAGANPPPQYEPRPENLADKEAREVQLSELAAPASELAGSNDATRSGLPNNR